MKVSVSIITYNHEPFIAQALDGVLMQQTDFPFEIVVGEDFSTDGTREIVHAYADRYPDRLKTVLPDRNLGNGGKQILAETFARCDGEYIARMDGDDYWSDPHKLQRQVDFLEAHPECAMCYHDVMVVYDDSSKSSHRLIGDDHVRLREVDELFAGNFVPSCAPLFRREALLPLPSWYQELPSGDWSLYLTAGKHGKLGYLPDVMGVYRVHAGGLWSGQNKIAQLESVIEKFETLNVVTGGEYRSRVRWALSDTHLSIAAEYARRNELRSAQRSAWAAWRHNPTGRGLRRGRLLRLLVKPYARVIRRLVARRERAQTGSE
jgi:glycosyltransferase involved in cell wall biosynthesis